MSCISTSKSRQCSIRLTNVANQPAIRYHTTTLPDKSVTGGITHVVMAFANSSLFAPGTAGPYEPFKPVKDVRAMFDDNAKVGIAIGGWGDLAGFSAGAATPESRTTYAHNVAKMAADHGFDFVDIDWEYPGGNGADYKQIPNENKTCEITSFPLFLQEIKNAIAPKPLSIAVPALAHDMIAYTPAQSAAIFNAVDMVNLMSYDMITRRDNATLHHSSVTGSLESAKRYIDLGLPAYKLNLGIAYYAKYFQTPEGVTCNEPVGCPIVKGENDDGSDAGTSGAITFEQANLHPPAALTNLTDTPDGSCGAGTSFGCSGPKAEGNCCSTAGFCGATPAHCGLGCQGNFGKCPGADITTLFNKALENGKVDEKEGGMWYWDSEARVFWTWDTPELINRKFTDVLQPLGLGGVMAWSMGEDSADWSHVKAVSDVAKKARAPLGIEIGTEIGLNKRHAHNERDLRARIEKPHGRLFAL